MRVGDIMTRTVHSIRPADSISEAARLMADNDVGALPIIDGVELVGMVTDRDIAVRAIAARIDPLSPVRRIMSEDVATCSPDDDVRDALETMANEQVRRMPVCDDRDRVVGIIGIADAAQRDPQPSEITETFAQICLPTGLHCQAPALA